MINTQCYTQLKQIIKSHEGLVLKRYEDTLGNNTIGYGHLMSEDYMPNKITLEEAENLFELDFMFAVSKAKRNVENFNELPTSIKLFLIELSFNIGNKVLYFKKALKHLKHHNYLGARREFKNSVWYSQVQSRADDMLALGFDGGLSWKPSRI